MGSSVFTYDPTTKNYDISYSDLADVGQERFTKSGSSYTRTFAYNLVDHLGSTRGVLNEAGTVSEGFAYRPYGSQISLAQALPGQETRKQFTTKELDKDIGLYYFGKRYYDAEVGRWTSEDPEGQFFDGYNYCGNDPVNSTDPDGSEEYKNSDGSANCVMKAQNPSSSAVYQADSKGQFQFVKATTFHNS